MKKIITLLSLAFLLSPFSCQEVTDGRDILAGDQDRTPEAEIETSGETGDIDTAGSKTWAMREVMEAKLDVFETGSWTPLTITSIFLATIDDDGLLTRTSCYFHMTPVMSMTTSVDAASLHLLSVDDVAFLDGDTVATAEHAWVWGAHLNDPVNDALPDAAGDTRIFDQDEDLTAGVTVHVHNGSGKHMGDRAFVRRSRQTYTGQKTDADHIAGSLAFRLDEFIISTTSDIINISPAQVQDEEKSSTFNLIRIDKDADCQWIMENGGLDLFL